MRKIIIILFAASLVLSSCGSTRLTPEEQQARAANVARAVNNLDMAIGITGVPHGPSRMLQMNKDTTFIWKTDMSPRGFLSSGESAAEASTN